VRTPSNTNVSPGIDGNVSRIKRLSWQGWHNCWSVENAHLKLIAVADVGPRIMYASFAGSPNLFYEEKKNLGKTADNEFRMYGGHRFWIAPENERTTLPDNHPADAAQDGGVLALTTTVGDLRKQIRISLAADAAEAEIVHTVTNAGNAPTELAPWALTVFRAGGDAALPLPSPAPWGPKHLLPDASLALWSYTDLGAHCWRIAPGIMRLHQPAVGACGFGMQKIGVRDLRGWAAYRVDNVVFRKSAKWIAGDYPDLGSNVEVFANSEFLELETLGPLQTLAPGASCSLVEHWQLTSDSRDDWFTHLSVAHADISAELHAMTR